MKPCKQMRTPKGWMNLYDALQHLGRLGNVPGVFDNVAAFTERCCKGCCCGLRPLYRMRYTDEEIRARIAEVILGGKP